MQSANDISLALVELHLDNWFLNGLAIFQKLT